MFRFTGRADFDAPSLIVGYSTDSGQLSPSVIDFLNAALQTESFCQVKPEPFFAMQGVAVGDNIVQFPENRFSYCRQYNLVLFKGTEPDSEKYRYLNAVLDVAQHYCHARELITVNGTVALSAHSNPRRLLAVFADPQYRKKLKGFALEDMNWQGPAATSSYLLWLAGQRAINGLSLWPSIPSYLAPATDYQAVKQVLSFLQEMFKLSLDMSEFDRHIAAQNGKISSLQEQDPEINRCIGMLEGGFPISDTEQILLVKRITDLLQSDD